MLNSPAPPPPPPPPPLPPSNAIDRLIKHGNFFMILICAASTLLVLLIVWHVLGQSIFKRLWLLPSHPTHLLALNAGTLALLSIVAKPPEPGHDSGDYSNEYYMLYCTVLICTVVGALMPSMAASTDLRDMWSRVIAVGVLILSTNFIIFLQLNDLLDDPDLSAHIHETAMEHKFVMASLFLLFLVLLVQALALEAMMSDVKATVLEQLEQLHIEAKPGYKALRSRPAWSWNVVEHNTHTKLMMVMTSNPQHLMARSPSAAIVGALVLSSTLMLAKAAKPSGKHYNFLQLLAKGHNNSTVSKLDLCPHINPTFTSCLNNLVSGLLTFNYNCFILLCGSVCVWRWARVALQEDRPSLSLLFATEPTYWRRKVNNFQCKLKAGVGPYVLEEGQYGFKEVVRHTTSLLMLCFVVSFHRLLVAMIRFTHILSALLVQKFIWPALKPLGWGIFILIKPLLDKRQVAIAAIAEPSKDFDPMAGVVCLEGEEARIVGQEFASAVAYVIIRNQPNRETTKFELKPLISILQKSNITSSLAWNSTCILDVLHQDNVPCHENLHVDNAHHQYGWSLTVVSLLTIMSKINEAASLETSSMVEEAMDAYWQAMEMMQVVDEQFVPCIVCSKEAYARAIASEWSKLHTNKQRWSEKPARSEVQLEEVDRILKAILEHVRDDIAELDKNKHVNIATTCSVQTMVSYTTHTVCQNLLSWWADLKNARATNNIGGDNVIEIIGAMVEHINVLIAEVVACCLSKLPTALDTSMTDAVLSCSVTKIGHGLLLIGKGKYLWEELQWPTLYYPTSTELGELKHWIHLGEMSTICST